MYNIKGRGSEAKPSNSTVIEASSVFAAARGRSEEVISLADHLPASVQGSASIPPGRFTEADCRFLLSVFSRIDPDKEARLIADGLGLSS